MILIRKSMVGQSDVAAIFAASQHQVLDTGELDFYLFDREARMGEAWGAERTGDLG